MEIQILLRRSVGGAGTSFLTVSRESGKGASRGKLTGDLAIFVAAVGVS